jgi:hypothetical protein
LQSHFGILDSTFILTQEVGNAVVAAHRFGTACDWKNILCTRIVEEQLVDWQDSEEPDKTQPPASFLKCWCTFFQSGKGEYF